MTLEERIARIEKVITTILDAGWNEHMRTEYGDHYQFFEKLKQIEEEWLSG